MTSYSYINAIETAVPPHRYTQGEACERMLSWIDDPSAKRYISKIYSDSGIDSRHSVVEDFEKNFFENGSEPGTQTRNRIFVSESAPMYLELARKLVDQAPGDITHIITVSCTGFYNPGADLQIIKDLKLSPSIERYHLGFMGCYAAFPAMRTADQFCKANPDAVVLVICLELCTLHLQLKSDLDSIIANSVFADGAAGLIISSKRESAKLEIGGFSSSIVSEGEDDMAWEIGDKGFNMVLSKYVPRILAANLKTLTNNLSLPFVDHWAVHPGGKSILDKVQDSLELDKSELSASRDTLREFGNMSSPTVLFVIKKLLESRMSFTALAMAFGPGLSVETAILRS